MNTNKALELVAALAACSHPYDGVDRNDSDAIDSIEDNMTGDFERDECVAYWDYIDAARAIVADDPNAASRIIAAPDLKTAAPAPDRGLRAGEAIYKDRRHGWGI